MKKYKFLALCAIILLVFCLFNPIFRGEAATVSRAECVLEVDSKRLLVRRQDEMKLPMASTTKILTAIIVIDDCDLDAVVTVPREAVGVEGSSVYLKEGDEYTVRDLLYGLMLRSGNDCAETLALYHSGCISAFAQVMNERAAALGAQSSHFVNPHGLPVEGHYTTACDLARISAYAMENERFVEIVSCKYYQPRGWYNKNKMLVRYDGATGVKTGFTLRAGRCLVTSAKKDGLNLLAVVLNSPQMYERTEELLNYCFSAYQMTAVYERGNDLQGLYGKCDFYYPLKEEEKAAVTVRLLKREPLPTQSGEIAGQMQILLKNNLIFSQNLYMM